MSQVLLDSNPFSHPFSGDALDGSRSSCAWLAPPTGLQLPFVVAFRKQFVLEEPKKFRAHVSGDERYHLFLNGELIGCGSERGDLHNWFFESYDFNLPAGEHLLVARVWALGNQAPRAQISLAPGFLFCPQQPAEIELLATGVADWDAKILPGYEWIPPLCAGATGANLIVHGNAFDWDFAKGAGDWQRAVISQPAVAQVGSKTLSQRVLLPATLPPQLSELKSVGHVRHVAPIEKLETYHLPVLAMENLEGENWDWEELLNGENPLTIPPHTRRRVIVDLEEYFCAYPEITTCGGQGSTLRVHWQESLFHAVPTNGEKRSKGNRDEIEGKFFVCPGYDRDGVGDTFLIDGGTQCHWSTLWWQCGRYIEICVETREEPLTIEAFAIRETRYPLEMESKFDSSEPRLQNTIPLMVRALQMCAHETYMDCPFYEQTQYIGDARLEMLTTYVLTRDDRLVRKALKQFDASRLPEGLTQSRTPSRVPQVIPPFSLWWVAAVHDFALWRDDAESVRSLLPGVRTTMNAFASYRNADGLIQSPLGWSYLRGKPNRVSEKILRGARYFLRSKGKSEKLRQAPLGWNFTDWADGWKAGVPPEADFGVSAVLNWQTVLVARQAAELEEWLGEPQRGKQLRNFAQELAGAAMQRFWNEERGMFADDTEGRHFSEHTQSLALLSGFVGSEKKAKVARALCEDENLTRATIYFSHYLFEAYREIGRMDVFFERMNLWFGLKERGFKTTFEEADADTTRSDCHAWGAHPLFHCFASVLGIRPIAPGFSKIVIAPQLAFLQSVSGIFPHPRGEVRVALQREGSALQAAIELPDGVECSFEWEGQRIALASTRETLSLA